MVPAGTMYHTVPYVTRVTHVNGFYVAGNGQFEVTSTREGYDPSRDIPEVVHSSQKAWILIPVAGASGTSPLGMSNRGSRGALDGFLDMYP